jgi:putative sigma-54 modulation protein
MQVSIQGRGMEISKKLSSYVQKKAERIDRYLPGVNEMRVEFKRESTKSEAPKTVQITLRRRRTMLRVEERNADPYIAFDDAIEKLYHRIARYKGRRIDRRHANHDAELIEAEDLPIEADEIEDASVKVVRVKAFSVVPMSADEAVEQMELLGHDFFVFMHEDDGGIKVVYRRKRGDYGLLQPEK